jgi:predicted RecA/RadA family phage recombinase
MRNHVQPGRTLTLTAPYAVASGDGLLVGSIFGVASGAAAIGNPVEAATEGVYELAKVSAQAWTAGAAIHWDDAARKATSVSAGHSFIGYAVEPAANPSDTGAVKLVHAAGASVVADRVSVQIAIPDLDEVTPAYAVAPIAGTVTSIYTVLQPDATGTAPVAAETTVTCSIDGTPITDGVVTIANGAAIGEMASATPSAANTVTAGAVLSAVSSGADTADHPCSVVFEIAG